MSGFVKGMVVGVVSFGLGFVVLSVVMPVEPPAPEVLPEVAADLPAMPEPAPAPVASAAPEAEAATRPELSTARTPTDAAVAEALNEALAASPTPEPAAEPAAVPSEAVPEAEVPAAHVAAVPASDAAPTPDADAAHAPGGRAEGVAEPTGTPIVAPDAEEASAETSDAEVVAEPSGALAVDAQPDAVAADVPSEAATPDGEPAPAETVVAVEPSAQGQEADAMPLSLGGEADTAAAEPSATEGSASDMATPAAPVEASAETAPEVMASDTSAAAPQIQPVPADPATVARIEPEMPDTETQAAEPTAPTRAAPRVPVVTDPERAPLASEPRSASEPSGPREGLPGPVAATRTPGGEPLIGTSGGAMPTVGTLPSGASGVAVRRGTGEAAQMPGGPVDGVTTGRLPSITRAPAEAEAPAPAAVVEPDADQPALVRYAAVPALAAGETALGVILEDSPEAETAILAFPVPVTILMNPYGEDAPRRAAAYRAAGHEIALRAESLPPRAQPSDITVILDAWVRDFPEAVAIVDVPINGIGSNAALSRELVRALATQGYGIVTRRNGLDAFLQAGRAAGLSALPVYRVLDDEGQSEPVIRRLIDRAAFEAERQPGVLILGRAGNRPTMLELADFVQGQGRGGVALVPASTVLLDQ